MIINDMMVLALFKLEKLETEKMSNYHGKPSNPQARHRKKYSTVLTWEKNAFFCFCCQFKKEQKHIVRFKTKINGRKINTK